MTPLDRVPLELIGVALIASDGDDVLDDLAALFARPAWMADAACKDHPQEWWFPRRGGGSRHVAKAKDICRRCLVRDECFALALADPETKGVWGATLEQDRRAVRAGRLSIADALAPPADVDRERSCEVCATAGDRHPADHRGTAAGRLAEPVDLCSSAYQFVVRHGRLPTADEIAHHAKSGRWRLSQAA